MLTNYTYKESIVLSYKAAKFGYSLNDYSTMLFGLKGCKEGKSYKLMPNIICGRFCGSYFKYIRNGKHYMYED